MLNIILFGPPGSGKGTQALKIALKYGVVHLSMGDLLRDEVTVHSELGGVISNCLKGGELIPDEIVYQLLELKLCEVKSEKGFLLDGFPRTLEQSKWLKILMEREGMEIASMIVLKVDEIELKRRIACRGRSSGRVDDQNEGIIQKRINTYNDKLSSIKYFYLKSGILEEINGVGNENDVFSRIVQLLEIYQLNT